MSLEDKNIVTALMAKKNARIFNYGNIVSVLIPFPFFIFWFGASMFVYALYRHHPNPRVGYYTQKAAYHYYALAGMLVPALTFAPGDFFYNYWLLLWVFIALLLVPISIMEIIKINKEQWHDVKIRENL
ncbi:MAG TPA: hypothetical protein EYH38_04400 [Leucothrix sp.]|nr:hypothetical protein [Leucothrix sp.]